jgi:glycerol-3-phosphate acyltransferase PlsY
VNRPSSGDQNTCFCMLHTTATYARRTVAAAAAVKAVKAKVDDYFTRCRLVAFDPRAVGSGNIGMTNVARAGGKGAAAVTFAGDFAKGIIPVLIARAWFGPIPAALAWVGLAAFIGAIASIFLSFHGGRGVATSVGVWMALAPLPAVIAIAIFAAVLAASRTVSLASICAAFALTPAVAALGYPRVYILLAIVVSGLVILRHRENIGRIMRGEEPTIGSRKSPPAGQS